MRPTSKNETGHTFARLISSAALNPNLQRALLLFEQSRFERAETELHQALAADPQDAYAHALLALCLSEREQYSEATDEARQSIHLGPDFPFAHYAMAHVYRDRNRFDEALTAISEAVRLDPGDPDYAALEAQVHLDKSQWAAALAAAERGLRTNPEHVGCTNLRAIALVKLGRKKEAGTTIDAALAKSPENALTHANQGWRYLEQNNPKKALEHFREALRLDPQNEWAQHGIVEALKARNPIYGLMLRYFLWMGKLSPGAQWGVIIGGYFANRVLSSVAKSNPDLAPWLLPLRILYLAFVLLTWTAVPLFNLLLRLNRFGRLALSPEQTVASSWFGACLGLALASLGLCVVVGFDTAYPMLALVFGVLLIPVAATFRAQAGWPRRTLIAATVTLATLGLGSVALQLASEWQSDRVAKLFVQAGLACFSLFLLGTIVFMWTANFVIQQRPKR